MDEFQLPCRLDKKADDTEIGAALKSLETDRIAILVDWVGNRPDAMVAMPMKRFYKEPEKEEDCLPLKPKDYRFVLVPIEEWDRWLVIAQGHGIPLIE